VIATWTLILTISGWHSYGGSAIHSVSGLASQAACEAAANAWAKNARAANVNNVIFTICVANNPEKAK